MCGHFRRNTTSHFRASPANTKLRSVARTYWWDSSTEKCLKNQKSKINILWTLSFQPQDAKTKEAQAKIAKREKVSCGRVLTQAAWLPRLACSNCCQGRLHQETFNNHIMLSSMNIMLQLSELRLSTLPLPPGREGYCVMWSTLGCAAGQDMVLGLCP